MAAARNTIPRDHGGYYPPGQLQLDASGQLHGASRADLEHKVNRLCEMLAEALEARCPGCGATRAEAVRR